MAGTLAGGRYLSGRPLDPPPRLFLGAVENPGAPPYEYRVQRALKKAGAGARFLQLQVGFQPERLEALHGRGGGSGLSEHLALIPSITILRSASALRFVNEKVPGIEVPARDDRARRALGADQHEACFDLAYEQASHALSLPGVARAPLHLVQQGRGHRKAVHASRDPTKSRKRGAVQCTRFSSRGLRP